MATRHVFLLHDVAEENLDVDLPVRAVNATRVVYEVRVEASAQQTVLDASPLRQPQVAAFADDLAAQLVRVDAQRIVAAVADVGMALATGLDVSPNAAVPEEVDLHPEDRANQAIWLDGSIFDAEHLASLVAQANRLGLAGKDAAALRNKFLVVIVPGRTGLAEQAPPLLVAGGGVGVWVEEDTAVIECSHEPDRL